MKRPTANVSGDNPGDSAPVAGEERDQTLFHLGVAPPHVFSPDWFLQYGYLGNAPLLAILIIMIVNRKEMGEFKSGKINNILLSLCCAGLLAVTVYNLCKLLHIV